ncbi:hypothetical protein GPUN_1798 [Glaciecola punicea ACAM 611]|jgi:hypothetical protein|uniref:Uncharacterized protein n=1 Tax=Glaciecola punicea ACAM 611 TaxID=1121923 RepID=H5TC87_9ALTE|nr:hypothetical protein [Glaciecola punicea]GAB55914.1 hypothetical protein GPUN_1798 [Glaciecola punicea ACAM 611]
MQKALKLVATVAAFVAIAYIVFLAGDLAMSRPLLALIPVAVLLFSVVVYVRIKDKQD